MYNSKCAELKLPICDFCIYRNKYLHKSKSPGDYTCWIEYFIKSLKDNDHTGGSCIKYYFKYHKTDNYSIYNRYKVYFIAAIQAVGKFEEYQKPSMLA